MDYDGATDSSIELAFENGIAEYIAEEYAVDTSAVLVNVDGFDMASLRAERIYVTLSGEAILLDYKKIEKELTKLVEAQAPREGVVIRIDNDIFPRAYKLKTKEHEYYTKKKRDAGEVDMEEMESLAENNEE